MSYQSGNFNTTDKKQEKLDRTAEILGTTNINDTKMSFSEGKPKRKTKRSQNRSKQGLYMKRAQD
jgi:hypothetical protein